MRTIITIDRKVKARIKDFMEDDAVVELGEMYQVIFDFYIRLRDGCLDSVEMGEIEKYWDKEHKPVVNNGPIVLGQKTIALDRSLRDRMDEFAFEDNMTLGDMYQSVLSLYVRMRDGQLTEEERKRVEEWWYKSKK